MGKITIGLIIITASIATIGCGIGVNICKKSYDQWNGFCDNVVGYDKEERDKQEAHSKELERIQAELETQREFLYMLESSATTWNNQLVRQLSNLTENQDRIYNLVYTNTDSIGLIGNQLYSLDQQISDTVYTLAGIQDQMNTIQYKIAALENPLNPPIEIIDFCGDNPGRIDEIGLRFSNNQIVSVQKINGKNILIKLTPGVYKTQDKTDCTYYIDESMIITW